MKNKIGIIGVGIVGDAVKHGMEKIGHEVFVHDLKLNTRLEDVMSTEICFICVPTPSKESSECDISIVDNILYDLHKLKYKGIIAIKSTIPPMTTKNFQVKYKNKKICFVPEFLRERCAVQDFIENHDICSIGSDSKAICDFIKKVHGTFPKKFMYMSPTEAEIVKYYNNIYAATLVTLANNFYEICQHTQANYNFVKEALIQRAHVHDAYINCDENLRGFSGPCLPKDVKALAFFSEKNNLNTGIFQFLDEENSKFKKTVLKGMRKE